YKLDGKNRVTAPKASTEDLLSAMQSGEAPPSKGEQVVALIWPRMINNAGRGAVIAHMKTGTSVYFAIFTKPADAAALKLELSPEEYARQRDGCAKTWNDILNAGVNIQTAEPVVK